jgi:predicted outer membrane repeat protein
LRCGPHEALAATIFSGMGTINLTNLGQLVINKDLTINGPSTNPLTINAFDPTPGLKNGDGGRVFNVSDCTAAVKTVTFSDLKLTGGDVAGGTATAGGGGAILNTESLTLDRVTVTGNSATGFGGGIRSLDGALTVSNSTISGNSAKRGGGIYSNQLDYYSGGSLHVSGCMISNPAAVTTAVSAGINIDAAGEACLAMFEAESAPYDSLTQPREQSIISSTTESAADDLSLLLAIDGVRLSTRQNFSVVNDRATENQRLDWADLPNLVEERLTLALANWQ